MWGLNKQVNVGKNEQGKCYSFTFTLDCQVCQACIDFATQASPTAAYLQTPKMCSDFFQGVSAYRLTILPRIRGFFSQICDVAVVAIIHKIILPDLATDYI